MMHKVTATIRPERLDAVRSALVAAGASGMTVLQAHGAGREQGPTLQYRGTSFSPYYLPKVTVEVVVPAGLTDDIVDALVQAACTGQVGDGIISISPVERVVRIRTGERDLAALDAIPLGSAAKRVQPDCDPPDRDWHLSPTPAAGYDQFPQPA